MSKAEIGGSRRGRPPSVAARTAILDAAREILDEVGPTRLTMEAVAQRAQVGKPTVYRHWANAQELAMAALIAPASAETPTGEGIAALEPLIDHVVTRLNSRRGRQMALMLAGAEPDGELFKAFANAVVLEARRAAVARLREAVAGGEMAQGADVEVIADMVLGAVFLRLLLRHAPLDAALARAVVTVARG